MRCFTAAAVLLAFACRCPADDKEPVYQGKPLSAWVDQLSDPSPTDRQEAAEAVSKIGPSTKSALGPLIAALGDTDGVVRDAAAVALASFRKDAVPPLVAALKAHDPAVRRGAASALSFIGADAHAAVGPLIAALKADDDHRRARARRLRSWAVSAPQPRTPSNRWPPPPSARTPTCTARP